MLHDGGLAIRPAAAFGGRLQPLAGFGYVLRFLKAPGALSTPMGDGGELLGNGSGGFAAAGGSQFAVGTSPRALAEGDFNGDGIPDLATANQNSNKVTVLLGDGSGGFTTASGSPFAAGSEPFSIGLGDFNGDGVPDLVTPNFQSGNITVLLGNGTGGFTPAPGSPFATVSPATLSPSTPSSVAVGDFNGDGFSDLLVENTVGAYVVLLLGDGRGGFTAAPKSPFPIEPASLEMAVADFNRDGALDVATLSQGGGNVTVLLGDGMGGFKKAAGSPFAAGPFVSLSSIVSGDFNGDGITDLAAANEGDNNVTVLLGDSSGGLWRLRKARSQ